MATAKQREALEGTLSSTLSRTVDFLKFAETKNAALLTFSSAWLAGLVTLLTGDRQFSWGTRAALLAALLSLAISSLISLRSFLPRLNLDSLHRNPTQPTNLLYFGHISKFEPSAYLKAVRERYCSTDQVVPDEYLNDLAVQVSVNASITHRKFITFYIGVGFAALGIAVLSITVVVQAYYVLFPK